MLVEVIMRSRMAHAAAIRIEMSIRDDNTNRQVAVVDRQVGHGLRPPHTTGMMMEEVSNKIHIEPSSTSQSQIITHALLAGKNHLAK